MTLATLTKKDTNILKGIAIILILFHNFFRWVYPITGENEFYFDSQNILNSLDALKENPFYIVNVFFNFLGHFGVQIFIFISAYGLTISTNNKTIKWGSFVWSRFKKLYPIFVLGAILYILFFVLRYSSLPPLSTIKDIALQLSLTANLVPDSAMIVTGPWWFFSLIFQFYVVFPLLIAGFRKYKHTFLFIVAIITFAATIFLNPFLLKHNLNLLQTCIGHMPEFLLGIGLASLKEIKIKAWLALMSLVVFSFSCYYKWLWPAGFLTFTIFFLWVYSETIFRLSQKYSLHFLIFTGNISVYIFVIHGFLRDGFLGLGNSLSNPFLGILGSLLFFLFVVIVAFGVKQSDVALKKYLSEGHFVKRFIWFLLPLLIVILAIYYNNYATEKFKNFSASLPERTLFCTADVLSPDSSLIVGDKDNTLVFGKPELRTNEFSHSGKFSFITDASNQFAPSLILNNPTACQKITISVWRKSHDSKIGAVVISIPETGFYAASINPIKSESGWDFIELSTEIPCYVKKQEVKVYCWNSSSLPVFFDDFKVVYF